MSGGACQSGVLQSLIFLFDVLDFEFVEADVFELVGDVLVEGVLVSVRGGWFVSVCGDVYPVVDPCADGVAAAGDAYGVSSRE